MFLKKKVYEAPIREGKQLFIVSAKIRNGFLVALLCTAIEDERFDCFVQRVPVDANRRGAVGEPRRFGHPFASVQLLDAILRDSHNFGCKYWDVDDDWMVALDPVGTVHCCSIEDVESCQYPQDNIWNSIRLHAGIAVVTGTDKIRLGVDYS